MATNKVYKLKTDKLLSDSIVYKDGNNYYPITNLIPVELYYDSTEKGTSGSIVLSDSAANYKYIEIFYNWEENYGYSSIKIDNPNGKLATILATYDNGTNYYSETARYSINGTNLTRNNSARWRFATGGANSTRTNTTSSGGSIRIYKVLGYK